jgi:NhaP-type Na+/H+ or K+/H+ antiporter
MIAITLSQVLSILWQTLLVLALVFGSLALGLIIGKVLVFLIKISMDI